MTEFAVTNLMTCVWQSCRSCINLNTAGKGLQSKLTFLNFLLFLISCSVLNLAIVHEFPQWLPADSLAILAIPDANHVLSSILSYATLCKLSFLFFFLFWWTKIFFLLAIFLILVFQMSYHKLQLRVKSDSMW